jgi:DNA (cytosine-5)-methyltransferase 1
VAEIEKFPSEVLQHHYPQVPNFGDITKITEEDIKGLGDIDLIVGGFPCQDLSVAGKRKGLKNDDGTLTRSGLFFVAMRLVGWARKHCGCRYVLIENVPGLLSSHKGTDFAAVVAEMAGLRDVTTPKNGWGNEGAAVGCRGLLEWSILDAQWFGVAQRRRRVFALADFGDWTSRPPVLLEREGVRRDTPPRREAGQGAAGFTPSSIGGYREGVGTLRANGGDLGGGSEVLVSQPYQVANCLTQRMHKGINTTLDEGQTPVLAFHHNAQPDQMNFSEHTSASLTCSQQAAICQYGEVAGSLTARHDSSPCADLGQNVVAIGLLGDETPKFGNDVMPTLRAEQGGEGRCVATALQVRRLLPEECERLQGFPDGYTRIPWRGKPPEDCPDGPRYKALGNSMAVPVMRWIGARIEAAKRGLIK